jgi:signal transduction histidine kinase/CheY-like chemotaxis protein
MLVRAANRTLIALLVEDNLADAEFIAYRLAPSFDLPNAFQVRLIHVTSANAACVALRHSAVKVIILDLSLPDAHGLEAIHRIRNVAPDVPIIVLTGASDEVMALDALHAGAQDYLLKPPPDGAVLQRILHYAMQRQQLLRERDAAVTNSAMDARRWRILADVGKVLAESTNRETAISQVSKLLVPSLADCAVIFLASDAQALALLEVEHVDQHRGNVLRERLRDLLVAQDAHVSFEAIHDSVLTSSTILDVALQTVLLSLGVAAGAALPLHFGGRLRGFMLMVASSARGNATADAEFGRSLADRVGLALEQGYLVRQAQVLAAARDRAVGIVSHDLGNSLNTIDICAEALLDPDPPPGNGVHNMAELIQRSVKWMRRISGDLLDKTNIDSGKLALDRHSISAAELVRSVQAMFAAAAEERAMELVIEQADDLPPVDADPDRLVQVLSNLLGNAIKFTPPGGRVVLSTRRVEPRAPDMPPDPDREAWEDDASSAGVLFTVTDTGPGIQPADLAHVFDWFWHAPPRLRGGRGFGLAIAKELVEAHRQSLHVESTIGRGSTFWFTMPASVPAKHRAPNTLN